MEIGDEDRRWRLEVGDWRWRLILEIEDGDWRWKLEIGDWRLEMEIGDWRLEIGDGDGDWRFPIISRPTDHF